MNKIVLSVIALLLYAGIARSQNLALTTLTNGPIANGDTLVVSGVLADFQLSYQASVVNSASTTKNVLVEQTLLSMISGCTSIMSWGLQMYPPGTVLTTVPYPLAPGSSNQVFQSTYQINNYSGTSIIRYTFFDAANPADSAWMLIKYVAQSPAGIAQNDFEFALHFSPNPSRGTFELSASEQNINSGKIIITNTEGREVQEIKLANTQSFTLDLSSNRAGIYFCSIYNGNLRLLKTQRIILLP